MKFQKKFKEEKVTNLVEAVSPTAFTVWIQPALGRYVVCVPVNVLLSLEPETYKVTVESVGTVF